MNLLADAAIQHQYSASAAIENRNSTSVADDTSVSDILGKYLKVDGVVDIVLDYHYCNFVQELWDEQNLSEKDKFKAELLLVDALMLHVPFYQDGKLIKDNPSPCWQVQPWFCGPGSKFINLLIHSFLLLSKEKVKDKKVATVQNEDIDITMESESDASKETKHSASATLQHQHSAGAAIKYEEVVDAASAALQHQYSAGAALQHQYSAGAAIDHQRTIYILDDKSQFDGCQLASSISEETRFVFVWGNGGEATVKTCPKGIGLFESIDGHPKYETCKDVLQRRIIFFRLKNKPQIFDDLLNLFPKDLTKSAKKYLGKNYPRKMLIDYFNNLRNYYLPIIQKYVDKDFHAIF